MNRTIADPGPAALSLFGFTLMILGLQRLVIHHAEGALVYAALIAALAEIGGGTLALIRGEGYLGTVLVTFGVWLLGFYLLRTDPALRSTDSLGIYVAVLLGPLAYLSIPAFRLGKRTLQITFVLISGTVLCLAVQYLDTSETFGKLAGAFALLSALSVWYLAFERLDHTNNSDRPEVAIESTINLKTTSATNL